MSVASACTAGAGEEGLLLRDFFFDLDRLFAFFFGSGEVDLAGDLGWALLYALPFAFGAGGSLLGLGTEKVGGLSFGARV